MTLEEFRTLKRGDQVVLINKEFNERQAVGHHTRRLSQLKPSKVDDSGDNIYIGVIDKDTRPHLSVTDASEVIVAFKEIGKRHKYRASIVPKEIKLYKEKLHKIGGD